MNKTREDYDIIDENNLYVKDPEKAKTHVADYFEDLYQAREESNGYEAWTNHIEETVEKITERCNNDDETEHEVITIYELNSAIKALQKKKATGPDEIPNEALIETDKKSRQIVLKAFNQVYKNETIPKEWQEGHIIRLYKGKGVKGKCSNERGITLSSNLGKLYERIINNKITPDLKMTNCQGGGKKAVSTADHIRKLSTYIKNMRKRKKTVYIRFLDVTKAYDKAWLKAIIYAMHNSGIQGKNLRIMRKLNEKMKQNMETQEPSR